MWPFGWKKNWPMVGKGVDLHGDFALALHEHPIFTISSPECFDVGCFC